MLVTVTSLDRCRTAHRGPCLHALFDVLSCCLIGSFLCSGTPLRTSPSLRGHSPLVSSGLGRLQALLGSDVACVFRRMGCSVGCLFPRFVSCFLSVRQWLSPELEAFHQLSLSFSICEIGIKCMKHSYCVGPEGADGEAGLLAFKIHLHPAPAPDTSPNSL